MRVPGPLTTRAFTSLPSAPFAETGGAGGTSLLSNLVAQDAALQRLYRDEWPPAKPPAFIRSLQSPRPLACDWKVDVAVCGGTLGLLLACALQLRGHRVAVLEAGPLRGRAQDWNTSMEELQKLVDAGVLDASELSAVAPLAFGPMSCRFGPSPSFELKLQGVLDVAVSPTSLLRCVRARFEAAGGVVLESTPVRDVTVHADGASLSLAPGSGRAEAQTMHARLVVDCMGHRSPIALQQRGGQRPDGVCVQVGSAARGAWTSQWASRGDFFVTCADATLAGPRRRARAQYFWQAFPSAAAASERSTYLFTYLRPSEEMPSLLEVMEDYWRAMPRYQRIESGAADAGSAGDRLDGVDVQRIMFGWFPTYRRNAPLSPTFDRVLSVGDASAVQSPISFGGFCAMLRHLPRYTRGLDLALRADSLAASDLRLLTPYLPNLGTAWMSSAAMTARPLSDGPDAAACAAAADASLRAGPVDEAAVPPAAPEAPYTLVNQLLEGNFKVMGGLPPAQSATFFRDVTTLGTLSAVLVGQTATMAPLLPRVVAELVGPLELAEFSAHLAMLALYTALHRLAAAAELRTRLGERSVGYELSCALDALAYGSGLDAAPPAAAGGGEAGGRPGVDGAAEGDKVGRGNSGGGGGGGGGGGEGADGGEGVAIDRREWWRRPPPTWPPRLDDPVLILGDLSCAYYSAFLALGVLTSGRSAESAAEGSALACSWLVGGAVTNAWDPTAVLPSLGLRNALGCVARMSVDTASTRLVIALAAAVTAHQKVDVKLLALELVLSALILAVWRALYTSVSQDPR